MTQVGDDVAIHARVVELLANTARSRIRVELTTNRERIAVSAGFISVDTYAKAYETYLIFVPESKRPKGFSQNEFSQCKHSRIMNLSEHLE